MSQLASHANWNAYADRLAADDTGARHLVLALQYPFALLSTGTRFKFSLVCGTSLHVAQQQRHTFSQLHSCVCMTAWYACSAGSADSVQQMFHLLQS